MRRAALITIWALVVAGMVIAVGMRVRAHRLADPVQALRRFLPWVPDDLAPVATMLGRSPDGGLQIELRGRPADVRRFAERNRMTEQTTPLYGMAPAQRWILADSLTPGSLVHLMLPSDGSPTLITVTVPSP